jgi:hypothetical protein
VRLDKILLNERLAEKSHIDEALMYQRRYGGRLETHLFRFGYVDEDRLLKALSIQLNCPSAKLSGVEIDETTLQSIPAHLAWSRLILPFEYDAVNNILKIACENPTDDAIRQELGEIATGKTIELYVALGAVLKCAIIKFYRSELFNLPFEEPLEPSIESRQNAFPGKDNQQVLIYNEDGLPIDELISELNELGYLMIFADSIDQLTEILIRKRPDILLLIKSGDAKQVSLFIENLTARMVIDGSLPVFLIPDPNVVGELSSLLKNGIEDVIPIENEYEPLVIKMNRIRERKEILSHQRQQVLRDLGTHGTLEDMNVIDLLQTMGVSNKTARVSISASGKQLTVYLDHGHIIYAECDDKIGPEAVFEGLPWHRGVWSIDPISRDDLPEPNNFQSNESILLEGCRRLDEQQAAPSQ